MRPNLSNKTEKQETSEGSLLIPIILFTALGIFFGISGIRGIQESSTYIKRPCNIESLHVVINEGSSHPFSLAGEFNYRYNGKTHQSHTYVDSLQTSSDYAALALKRKELLRAKTQIAYVKIGEGNIPEAAYLDNGVTGNLGALGGAIFLLVIATGLTVEFFTPRALRKLDLNETPVLAALAGTCMVIFAGSSFILQLGNLKSSQNWTATPCTVIKSSETEDRLTMLYTYKVEDQIHYSTRILAWDRFIRYRQHKGAVDLVRSTSKGSIATCYVNPTIPEQAALIRSAALNPYTGLGLVIVSCIFALGLSLILGRFIPM